MFTKTVTVQIARPPDEVFAFVADARNRPLWDPSVDTEEITSPQPIGVGSTVRTGLRAMGRDYVLTWQIVEHEPPTRQTIESTSGPFATTLAYRLGAHDGGTSVEFSVTGRPTGMLRLLRPLIARNTQKNLDRASRVSSTFWKPAQPLDTLGKAVDVAKGDLAVGRGSPLCRPCVAPATASKKPLTP